MAIPPYGAPPLPAQSGNSGKFLTTNGSAASWAAGGGGQSPYDAIVAASGGTHTTLGAALAAASNGWTIYVTAGTYTETTLTNSLTSITIIGENRDDTTIDMGTTTWSLSGTGLVIQQLGFTASTGKITCSGARTSLLSTKFVFTDYSSSSAITMSGSYSLVDNMYLQITKNTGTRTSSIFSTVSNDNIKVCNSTFLINTLLTSTAAINLAAVTSFENNHVESQANTSAGQGIVLGAQGSTMIGNNLLGFAGLAYTIRVTSSNMTVVGNRTLPGDGGLRCIYTTGANGLYADNTLYTGAASGYGMFVDATGNQIINCHIEASSATSSFGIYVESARDRTLISNNYIGAYGVGVQVNANTCDNTIINGNYFDVNTTALVDNGITTNIIGNEGVDILNTKKYILMKNTSGATIAAGNIVTYKAVAAGNEVTTTTTASDNQVFGMAVASIGSTAFGYIQVAGKTTLMTVNGTTAIAVGDFITTFTTVGIGRKAAVGTLGATPGDQAIAIALEAYSGADNNGVIDALIIQPRRL